MNPSNLLELVEEEPENGDDKEKERERSKPWRAVSKRPRK